MDQIPAVLREFSAYKVTVQNRSQKTVEQYCTDLCLLFRYIIASREGLPLVGEDFDRIDILSVDMNFIRSITTEELYAFLMFAAAERANKAGARARKLSAIKSFYKYLTGVKRYFDNNPAKDIEAPSVKAPLPKYLSLEESRDLLDSVDSDRDNPNGIRDTCILTLFLNCGMRLSELVGINISDLDQQLRSVRVLGKGSKERIIYLNAACRSALCDYLDIRRTQKDVKEKNALFVSRLGNRMSPKTVQYTVYKYLRSAGLSNKHYSVHKLRHTAATLMYQTGNVDVRVLKDILGHSQLNTTQIYTHVSDMQMEKAMAQNPLSGEGEAAENE